LFVGWVAEGDTHHRGRPNPLDNPPDNTIEAAAFAGFFDCRAEGLHGDDG